MDVSTSPETDPHQRGLFEDLVAAASRCEMHDESQAALSRYYSIATRMHDNHHACTALLSMDPRSRQMTVEELGCYHISAPTRRAGLISLRYAIETAIAELDQS